jgi:hypothetical protein
MALLKIYGLSIATGGAANQSQVGDSSSWGGPVCPGKEDPQILSNNVLRETRLLGYVPNDVFIEAQGTPLHRVHD